MDKIRIYIALLFCLTLSFILPVQAQDNTGNNSNRYNTLYSYDCMGNITSLSRNGLLDDGSYGLIDDLMLTYDGNQLMAVSDDGDDPTYNNAWNFMDCSDSEIEYEYDANGNVTKDLNRNILSIQYNTLNLPSVIEFAGGKTIKYTYSADGHKLRAVYTTETPATNKRIDYCGSLIFENGQLKQMLFEGGYIPMDDMSGAYCFYVKDHLGNNRMVVHPSGTVEQVNNFYPYGGLMSNSTGWNTQRYRYNGKELDRMHGLDWYDYGARWMDAAIGRWHVMDPLCEKYYDVSPYAYCHNNPIMFIDLDGKDDYFDAFGKFLFNKGNGGAIYIRQGEKYIVMQRFDLRKQSNMQMAANVVGYYANAIGIKYNMNGGSGEVGVSTLHSTDKEKGRVLAGTKDGNIYIKMTNGHFDDYMYDSYQLKSTLVHENEHKKHQDAFGENYQKTSGLDHAKIVLKEIESPDFDNCSKEYKASQIQQFRLFLRNAQKTTDKRDGIKILYKKLNQLEKK